MMERTPQLPTHGAQRALRLEQARDTREKARRAVELRLIKGLTFREIAEQLDYKDPSGPRRAVEAEMRRQGLDRPVERLDEWRQRQLAEINGLLNGWYPRSLPSRDEKGVEVAADPFAVAIVERCWKARALILGLAIRKEELLEALADEGGDAAGLQALLADRLRVLAEDRRRRALGEPGLIDREAPPLLPEPMEPPGLRIAEARIVDEGGVPAAEDGAEAAPEDTPEAPSEEAPKRPLDDTLVGRPLKL